MANRVVDVNYFCFAIEIVFIHLLTIEIENTLNFVVSIENVEVRVDTLI